MYLLQRKVDIWRMIETCSHRQEWVTVSCIQYTQGKNLVMKIPNWDFGLWHNELVVNFPEAVRRYLYNLISISCSAALSAKVGCGDLKWCQEKWNHHWSCDATNVDTRHVSRVTMHRDNIYIFSGDIGGWRGVSVSKSPSRDHWGTGAGECVYPVSSSVTLALV